MWSPRRRSARDRRVRHPTYLGLILLIAAFDIRAGTIGPAVGETIHLASSISVPQAGDVKGARIYAIYCAVCHGKHGEGRLVGSAPPLNEAGRLSRLSDEELLAVIAEGRPGTLMKAWARRHGGELTDAQIRLLVDFLRHGLHAKGA